jgi:Caspase domain
MLRVDVVHRAMERSTNTNILFLDACRDNPLARNLARAMGTRSSYVGRGLATIESGVGTLISFSTQPGNVALDGTGRNSPFAGSLVKHIASSADSLSDMLIAVRNDVRKETQNKQVPWEHSALTGRFYFNPAGPTIALPKLEPARLSEAAGAWGAAKDSTNMAVLEAYIARFKDTFYAELARARIDELKKLQVSVATVEPEQKTKRPERIEQKALAVEQRKISLLMLSPVVAQRAGQGVEKLHDQIEDGRAKGTPLRKIAEQLKLPLQHIEGIDHTGKTAEGKPAVTHPDLARLTEAFFSAAVGAEQEPLKLSDGGYAWFDLIAISNPRR